MIPSDEVIVGLKQDTSLAQAEEYLAPYTDTQRIVGIKPQSEKIMKNLIIVIITMATAFIFTGIALADLNGELLAYCAFKSSINLLSIQNASRPTLSDSYLSSMNETEASGIPHEDDLSDPGNPAVKTTYTDGTENSQGPADHFDYNTSDYWVQARSLHGTSFEVAIHNSVLGSGTGPGSQEFADYVFHCFHITWHIFGGYLYDRYGIKVRSTSDSTDWSLSRVGVSIRAADYADVYLSDFIAHEMIHSWIGKLIQHEPDGSGNIFQLETWITEGATSYYAARHMGFVNGESLYTDTMVSSWIQYSGYTATQFDLSIENLASQIGESMTDSPDDDDYINMLYERSMLLNYMLDLGLSDSGASLDSLMRYLYENYGLTENMWTQEDIPPALQGFSGQTFDSFFNTLLYTNTPLPLDGSFQLLGRNGFSSDPAPDIKAGNSDGPVVISRGELITVAISLSPGSRDGAVADWWVAATSPMGLYWYTLNRGWIKSDTPIRVYGGPLWSLSPYTILKISALPIGSYNFYFGVDDNMDSTLDATYVDSVSVTIQ